MELTLPGAPGAPSAAGCACSAVPTTNPTNPTNPTDPARRVWLMATAVGGGVAATVTAVPFVSTFAPSERAKASGGPVEVDIADLAPGDMKTVEWRGKPVWVVRRTPEMIAALKGQESLLADPGSTTPQQPEAARNPTRSLRADVFVAVGICTHLGCSPTSVPQGSANPSLPDNWPGGYFCPCHGSAFDGAGRVYNNTPAPTNLEVPPHRYAGDARILIGEDDAG